MMENTEFSEIVAAYLPTTDVASMAVAQLNLKNVSLERPLKIDVGCVSEFNEWLKRTKVKVSNLEIAVSKEKMVSLIAGEMVFTTSHQNNFVFAIFFENICSRKSK